MFVWISTVGWSPYAVINPIWAFCKYKREIPQKVILMHTKHNKILKNVEFCKKKIKKILKEYSNKNNFEPNIEDYILETENIDIFTDNLEKILNNLEKEVINDKDKGSKLIILDMTPGRKYMSAKIMNIGDKKNSKGIPIQVYYLDLEDANYLNYPYPLIPVVKQDLIDILEEKSLEVNQKLNSEITQIKDFEGRQKLNTIIQEKLYNIIQDEGLKNEFLVYSAIYQEQNTIYSILKFLNGNGFKIEHDEASRIIRLGILNNYISTNRDFKKSRSDFYNLSDDGMKFLNEIVDTISKEKSIEKKEFHKPKERKHIDEINAVKNINFNEKSENKDYVDLSLNELILLINELYLNNFRKFKIIDSLYGFNLSEINLNDTGNNVNIYLGNLLSNFPNDKKRKEYFDQDEIPDRFYKEIPSKNEFKEIIYNLGIFFNKDYNSIFKPILKDFMMWNPISNNPPIIFAFDTSTYMHQTYTNLLKQIKLDEDINKTSSKLDFFVSRGVRNELKQFEDIYDQHQYNNYQDYFKKIAKYPNITIEFIKQSTLKVRKKFIGHEDFLKCIQTTNYKLIDESDIDDNDLCIIDGLDKECSKNPKIIQLFTHDEKFLNRTQGGFTNIKCTKLSNVNINDNTFNAFSCDWIDLTRYLYFLAIIFGAIIINIDERNNLILFGIWRNKKTKDWNRSKIRIFYSNSVLFDTLKDLNILQ